MLCVLLGTELNTFTQSYIARPVLFQDRNVKFPGKDLIANWVLTKVLRTFVGKRKIFLINGATEIRYPHADEWSYLSPVTKINSKCIKDLIERSTTLKLLEEIIPQDTERGKYFLDKTPKT